MYIPNLSSILLKSRIQIYFWRKHLQESTLLKSILKYINEFMFQTCFENLEGGVDLKYQTEAHWDVTKLDVYTL